MKADAIWAVSDQGSLQPPDEKVSQVIGVEFFCQVGDEF